MRQIAKEAGCSHTTIYIYFKDKEALLQQLAMPPLQALMGQIDRIAEREAGPEDKLRDISLAFVEFCLTNRGMYALFFNVKSVRVDEKAPELEINRMRNALFGKLTAMIQASLRLDAEDERLLMFARIYFYTLHGIVATYAQSEETVEQLMDRLEPTFSKTAEVLLDGFRQQMSP